MEKDRGLNEKAQDVLKELGNIGTGNAVTALSVMLGHSLEILSTRLSFVSYQEISGSLGNSEEEKIGIMLEAVGDVKGVFLFLLDRAFAGHALASLLGQEETELTELDDMGRSVFCELGNIMCGSYVNALAQLLNKEITVSVPDVCMDMGGAIFNTLLSRMIAVSDTLLLIDNVIRLKKQSLSGQILFFPELESMNRITEWLEELYSYG